MLENEALAQPVLGHERHALGDRVAGTGDVNRDALDEDLALALLVDSEQDASEGAAAAAEQSGDADHFAGKEREVDCNGLVRSADASDFEKWRPSRSIGPLDVRETPRAASNDVLD